MSFGKERDGYYRADFRVRGIPRLHLSLGTKRAGEARARYDAVRLLFTQRRLEMIAQLRDGTLTVERVAAMVAAGESLAPIAAPTVDVAHTWGTVEAVVERYLGWLETHPKKGAQTFAAARSQLRRFLAFPVGQGTVADLPLEAVTSEVVESYQRSLIAAKAPANTITGYMTRVGALWNWLARQERRAAQDDRRAMRPVFSPVDPEMMLRETTARQRYLSPDEADRLLAATPEPLLAMVGLGLLAGLRLGEAAHLSPRDVDLEIGIVTVHDCGLPDGTRWRPKTKRSARSVPVADDLRPLLARQLERDATDAWLTPRPSAPAWPIHQRTFGRDFVAVVERAKLPTGRRDPNGVTFHTLRHTFASWLVMRGVDLYTVAQLLGDTLATVEKTYAHLSPDFKKGAIAKLAGAVRIPATDTERATETGGYVK